MTVPDAAAQPDAATRPARLVLASQSSARRKLLANAGVIFDCDAAQLDETAVTDSLRAEGATPEQAAETLAELKALRVSRRHPGALVIGADQMLDCDGRWFDKPDSAAQAAAQLRALAGRTHRLLAALVVVRDGQRLWHHLAEARLTMRPLGDAFIDSYLAEAGDAVFRSVGAYQLEGRGAQLFSRVEGDYFTVLGLPLLPLLDFLRNHGTLPT